MVSSLFFLVQLWIHVRRFRLRLFLERETLCLLFGLLPKKKNFVRLLLTFLLELPGLPSIIVSLSFARVSEALSIARTNSANTQEQRATEWRHWVAGFSGDDDSACSVRTEKRCFFELPACETS